MAVLGAGRGGRLSAKLPDAAGRRTFPVALPAVAALMPLDMVGW
ncbi:hypothetical protein ABZ368_01740 [Streptomyces sp. NPDC005908]